MRTNVMGVGFDAVTMEDAVLRAFAVMDGAEPGYIVTPNPEIVWACRGDARLGSALDGAAMCLPDAVGITLGARILGQPLPARVPGIDFAAKLLDEMARRGRTLYLLGAKPGVAERAAARLQADHAGLIIAGLRDGYFSDDGAVIAAINAAKPDVLFVCLGAPRQELWISAHLPELDAGLVAALGGALDVWAGEVTRAPVRWQKLGLEWFYRLLHEPWRFWRMTKLPLFLIAVVWNRIRGAGGARRAPNE